MSLGESDFDHRTQTGVRRGLVRLEWYHLREEEDCDQDEEKSRQEFPSPQYNRRTAKHVG